MLKFQDSGRIEEMNVENKTLKSNILTEKELKFIDEYLLHGNAALAVREAGYKTKEPYKY